MRRFHPLPAARCGLFLLAMGISGHAGAAEPAAAILAANHEAVGSVPPAHPLLSVTYELRFGGLTGKATSLTDTLNGRFVDQVAAGPIQQTSGYDGVVAWTKDESGNVNRQEGGQDRQLAVNDAYRRANLWWRPDFGGASITSEGVSSDHGQDYDLVEVVPKDGLRFEAWFDRNTHLLVKVVEAQGAKTFTTTYGDYRRVDGAEVAFRQIVEDSSSAANTQEATIVAAAFEVLGPDNRFSPPASTVFDFTIHNSRGATSIPFQLIGNHIYAEVSVNGAKPDLFIFDSGGLNIVTPERAAALGLTVEGELAGGGVGEGTVKVGIAKAKSLSLGEAEIVDPVLSVLPLGDLSGIEGLPETGMVGYETFRRFVTRIDYGSNVLTLIDPKSFDPKDAGTPVHFDYAGRSIVISGQFENLAGRFRIDTGARDDLSLNRPFAEAHHLRESHPHGVEAVSGWGAGGPVKGYIFRAKSVSIGPVEVRNIVASESLNEKGAFGGGDLEGNIGGGVLKRFILTLDYPHQTLYLKPILGPIADVATYDRAGMWINLAPTGFVIASITTGGPAATAGLKAGDIIRSVDGAASGQIRLWDLRKRLRDDPPGTTIRLTVASDQGDRNVTLQLRDLIDP